jgi:MFS family permease
LEVWRGVDPGAIRAETTGSARLDVSRALALAGYCAAAFLSTLDASLVNLVLPPVQHEMGVAFGDVAWVPNAYVLAYAVLIPTAGAVGDRLGRRALFVIGTVLFGTGSLVCAFAPDIGALVAGRVLQGCGAAGMLTLAAALISAEFADRRQWAFGAYVVAANFGGVVGPVVGGALAAAGGWRLAFWSQVPLALIVIACTARRGREVRGDPRRVDGPGLLLISGSLVLGSWTLLEAGARAWNGWEVAGAAIVSGAALAAFLLREARAPAPMLPLSVFGNRLFTTSTLLSSVAWFAALSTSVYVAVYLETERGMDLLSSALVFTSWNGGAALSAMATSRIVLAWGRPAVLRWAGIGLFAVVLPWAFVRSGWPLWLAVVLLAAFGALVAQLFAVGLPAALSQVPVSHAGTAAATFGATRQIGSLLGVTLPGAVLSGGLAVGGRLAPGTALLGALDRAFLVRAAVVAVGVAIALALLRRADGPAA